MITHLNDQIRVDTHTTQGNKGITDQKLMNRLMSLYIDSLSTTQNFTITHCLPFLVQQEGHLYCFMLSALAGVIFTHFPWYQRSHTSQHIQNSTFRQCPPQLPHSVSPCSSSSSSQLSSINFLVIFISPSIDLYTKPKRFLSPFLFLCGKKSLSAFQVINSNKLSCWRVNLYTFKPFWYLLS